MGEYDLKTLRVDAYFFENGEKNLSFQKYPDTVAQGLIYLFIYLFIYLLILNLFLRGVYGGAFSKQLFHSRLLEIYVRAQPFFCSYSLLSSKPVPLPDLYHENVDFRSRFLCLQTANHKSLTLLVPRPRRLRERLLGQECWKQKLNNSCHFPHHGRRGGGGISVIIIFSICASKNIKDKSSTKLQQIINCLCLLDKYERSFW